MDSQVTTKRGDAGTTVAISGDRYSKSHPILECCGQLDTLRAGVALCRQTLLAGDDPEREPMAEFLLWVIHTLFLVGSQCNDPEDKHPEYRRRNLGAKDIERLERHQAGFEKAVRLPRSFIACASNRASAEIDLLCTQARTFERSLQGLREVVPQFKATELLVFANRLSDTLYMLARYLEHGHHIAVDYSTLDEDA
jgi:cob(I)alamin adenosyltransferase